MPCLEVLGPEWYADKHMNGVWESPACKCIMVLSNVTLIAHLFLLILFCLWTKFNSCGKLSYCRQQPSWLSRFAIICCHSFMDLWERGESSSITGNWFCGHTLEINMNMDCVPPRSHCVEVMGVKNPLISLLLGLFFTVTTASGLLNPWKVIYFTMKICRGILKFCGFSS